MTQRKHIEDAWKKNQHDILVWAYDHAPLREHYGTPAAEDDFEACIEFGVALNDALRRHLDPAFQPAWPR